MRELFRAMYFGLAMLWPLTAFAAQASFGTALAGTEPLAIAMTLVLSTLSGLTALLAQMKRDYEAAGKIDRLWLYVSSKMMGSNLAGVAMFFAAEYWKFTSSATAAAIILAAFGGTWLLEQALNSYVSKYLPKGGS